MVARPTLVAVDTNVLLDLAVPKDRAHDAIAIFRRRVPGIEFVVPPAVIEELDFISLALKSCDVNAVLVRTPREIVRQFG